MANYATLKAAINAVIKANGNKEITGTVLNETLTAMVNSLGANYQFAGVATPSTNPGTPDQNVFYLAGKEGTYTNFNSIVLPNGVSILKWNGSWSGETVLAGDGVFDISAYKATGGTLATFADLSAALDGGNNIPSALRKGGMSVKFIQGTSQSYYNKYVQYRLMSDTFNTTVANWQGVDKKPTDNSKNLIESGGVFENCVRQEDSLSSEDLKICDDNDSIIVEFSGGGIKTKNFNSANVYTKSKVYNKEEVYNKDEIDEELLDKPCTSNSIVDLDIADEYGNVIGRYHDGIHETKYPAPYTKENAVSELDFSDKDGNIALRIQDGYPKTRNFDGSKLSSSIFNQVRSSIGEGQMRVSYPSIASDANIELLDFPRYLDTRKFISFIGYMSEFPSNAYFDFGFRYKYNGQYWHSGEWIRVTSTNVEVYYDLNENQSVLEQSYVHGLTFSAFVKVFIYLREDYSIYIILETINGKYVIEHKRDTGDYSIDLDVAGHPILFNNGISFSDAQITAGSADFKSPIWIFGDSYSTASYGYTRIGKQLMDLGLSQNTCYNHCGGNNHQDAWEDLQRMLPFGTPRMIVWLLGVNGVQTINVIITDMLKELCNSKGIELVLQYPPLFPNSLGIDTTNLRNKVIETGCRIVNFSKAVGCHIVNNDAVWYEGYLAGDNIHPTELGSRALVMQIINDVPEVLQWGINENPVYYSADNN